MINQLKLNDYKKEIADLYSRRSQTYDNSDWHTQIAHRLVEYAQISPGQHVLDIATGTGMVAIEAAQIVRPEGRVVGVDISTGMLEVAKQKVEGLSFEHVEFQLADAEALNFPANSFDRVLCSSALIWMADIPAALRQWMRFLKPGGLIGFHAFAQTAFVGGVVVQKVVEKYGVSLAFNKPTGTVEKCQNLLQQAGFEAIEIQPEQYGSYISLEQAKGMWTGNSHVAPGQFPNPVSQLSSELLAQVKAEFETELEALNTDEGVWNDITVFFTFGRKPVDSSEFR
ncbi:class I SAM-dependent methyltransferase [Brasilonema bromeliae]|uniref:Methyltransferase n=1 Tax=Brasilonema bromeliae SPC951 TaxID=385972 RepID=A0ABX1P5I8_9CYAN|nr:methyltransferase domain-containing protein [Brasilonema bromeliae]NMG19211.1 methyltransferase [Brasilonema bromeliae SPC951]